MTRKAQYPIEPPRTITPLTPRGRKKLWISAVLYILFCCWLGPDGAFWLTIFAAFVAGWLWLCSRFPFLSYATGLFLASLIGGFIGGVFGFRSGGGYGYYYAPRRRRRRW